MPSLAAPPKVVLSPQELFQAAQLGTLRQYQSMIRNNRDTVWEKPFHEALSAHVVGAVGEMAVAKYMGTWFPFTEGAYKLPDLWDLEIRTRTKDDWDLLVRPNDPDASVYIGVTLAGGEACIQGYIGGNDAKREEWLNDWGNRGRPVYSVPKSALKHISILKSSYWD